MQFKVLSITPEMAQEMLAKSEGNRPIKRATVEMYARDMLNGNWKVNGETIVFDEAGVLRDGHHRLSAIIKANKPVLMCVIYGAPETTIFDNGVPRSARDQLIMNGGTGNLTQFGMQSIIRYHYTIQHKISKVSLQEIQEFYERNETMLTQAYELTYGGANYLRKASVGYAVFCALECGVHLDALKEFMRIAKTGNFTSVYDAPALKLREYIFRNSSGQRSAKYALLCVAENAISDFVNRKQRKNNYKETSHPVYSNQRIIKLL